MTLAGCSFTKTGALACRYACGYPVHADYEFLLQAKRIIGSEFMISNWI
jgi:hypothetical protein